MSELNSMIFSVSVPMFVKAGEKGEKVYNFLEDDEIYIDMNIIASDMDLPLFFSEYNHTIYEPEDPVVILHQRNFPFELEVVRYRKPLVTIPDPKHYRERYIIRNMDLYGKSFTLRKKEEIDNV